MSGARARRLSARTPLAVLAAGLALLAGCTPPPPAGLETLEQAARHGAERREHRLVALELHGVLRVDGRATGKLPAVSLSAHVASPDRVRLQCRWLVGLLADVALRGDSLTVWMPGERMGLSIPQLSDTLGLEAPAGWFGRALVAGWQAPAEAWARAVADSAGAALEWAERGARWTLSVDRDGRPRAVSVSRGERRMSVRYGAWHGHGAGAWPGHIELADGDGWLRARIELEDMHAKRHAQPAWFALELPANARRLELDEVKRILSGRGGER